MQQNILDWLVLKIIIGNYLTNIYFEAIKFCDHNI